MKTLLCLLAIAHLVIVGCSVAPSARSSTRGSPMVEPVAGLKDTDVLIIRHAEKPDSGQGLSPAGQARADAYVRYFRELSIGSRSLAPDCLIACADSAQSWRPRLTLEPLGEALNLPINLRFAAGQIQELVRVLRTKRQGSCILICWKHGSIPELLSTLGANPSELLPEGTWPDDKFTWLIDLRYDQDGRLVPGETKRIPAACMPGDAK